MIPSSVKVIGRISVRSWVVYEALSETSATLPVTVLGFVQPRSPRWHAKKSWGHAPKSARICTHMEVVGLSENRVPALILRSGSSLSELWINVQLPLFSNKRHEMCISPLFDPKFSWSCCWYSISAHIPFRFPPWFKTTRPLVAISHRKMLMKSIPKSLAESPSFDLVVFVSPHVWYLPKKCPQKTPWKMSILYG